MFDLQAGAFEAAQELGQLLLGEVRFGQLLPLTVIVLHLEVTHSDGTGLAVRIDMPFAVHEQIAQVAHAVDALERPFEGLQ